MHEETLLFHERAIKILLSVIDFVARGAQPQGRGALSGFADRVAGRAGGAATIRGGGDGDRAKLMTSRVFSFTRLRRKGREMVAAKAALPRGPGCFWRCDADGVRFPATQMRNASSQLRQMQARHRAFVCRQGQTRHTASKKAAGLRQRPSCMIGSGMLSWQRFRGRGAVRPLQRVRLRHAPRRGLRSGTFHRGGCG